MVICYFQIFLLLFLLLYLASFAILRKFKRQGKEDYYSTDEEEVTVYRISTWLCTFSLAVSIGAVLLLPISIVSNEILILYPNSYYIKWLNSSLVHGNVFYGFKKIVGLFNVFQGFGITCFCFQICHFSFYSHLPTYSRNRKDCFHIVKV